MTTYYCGAGGSDAANGLSWANRKLTITGIEDIPVVAGDTAYIGPGVYRELLTVDVSGSVGSPITYIGDITGEHTDSVGGIVRVTGSDNDQTAARASCITASSKNYRTFRGFAFDTTSTNTVSLDTSCSNWITEDCWFGPTAGNQINMAGTGTANITRRCVLAGAMGSPIYVIHSSTVDNTGHVFENCVMLSYNQSGIRVDRVGGITARNCLFMSSPGIGQAVRVNVALSAGQTMVVRNCLIVGTGEALRATVTTEFDEDYNNIIYATTARVNVNAGANSVAYPALFNPLLLLSGFNLPQFPPFSLSEWSQVRAITGSGTATDDLFGLTRPATAAKLSWGPVQWADAKRETGTVQAGSASLKLADAGIVRVRRVPVTNVSTTISLYVRWEADYTGTKPRMVIKQPGQSDRTTTATGAADTWEQLTDTFTPAALPPYVDVFFESSNTAAATNFDAFADSLAVS